MLNYPRAVLLLRACLCGCSSSRLLPAPPYEVQAEVARGVVFHDQNGNGTREPNEPGIPNVRVSNGSEIARSDADGKYELSVDDDTILFVIKPRNWHPPINEQNLPQFYYIHKPAGSPDESFEFPGVDPTGPLPDSVDFALTPSAEPEEFSIILMGDPQPVNRQEVRFYANDLIAELVDSKVAFGISLGDIVGNELSLFGQVNATQAKVGVPWHNLHGNHDINLHSPNDQYSDETFESIYGPTSYAFQWASVHFIVLDNVVWQGAIDKNKDGKPDRGNYFGKFSDRQLKFVANYIAEVPTSECLVICTHIPLIRYTSNKKHGTRNLTKLLELLRKHPHQLSFSAHTHYTRQDFAGGPEDKHTDHQHLNDSSLHHHHFQIHHHHNAATGSGNLYHGPKDEQGFPMTPQRDGVPNGYLLATFTGSDYKLRYKAARLPKDYQLAIHAPETTLVSEVSTTEILVNVFNGNERSKVQMRVRGTGDWVTMTRTEREDPAYRAFFERALADKDRTYGDLKEPVVSPHIWAATLPEGIGPGVHVLEVESKDMFGQIDRGIRLIEVDPDPTVPVAESPEK